MCQASPIDPALALARTAANLSTPYQKTPWGRSISERPNPMIAELRSNNCRRWGFRWDAIALVRRRLKDSDTIHPRAQGNGPESRVVVRFATGGTNNDENKGAPYPIALSCTTLHTWRCVSVEQEATTPYLRGDDVRTVPVARWANRRDMGCLQHIDPQLWVVPPPQNALLVE